MTLAETYNNMDDQGIYVSVLHGDRVFAGGACSHLYQLSLTGSVLAQVPVSATVMYSLAFQELPQKVRPQLYYYYNWILIALQLLGHVHGWIQPQD
jgi:hypothetical protein